MKRAQVKIYALVDPVSFAVRYIGKTENTLARRLNGHMYPGGRKSPCKEWVLSLRADGARPVIILIEEVAEGVFWAKREAHWIEYYRAAGASLLNIADGGGGPSGIHLSDDARDRLRKSTNARYSDPEQRRHTSEKSKAYWSTPGAREAQAARMRKQLTNPVTRAALHDGLKAATNSPEYREKRSVIAKEKIWGNDITREKYIASFNSDESRSVRSGIAKRQWANKEIRKKMGPAISAGKLRGRKPT